MNYLTLNLIDFRQPEQLPFLQNLQGNILKGHGRDYTAHIFFSFIKGRQAQAKECLHELGESLTSAYGQLYERETYKRTKSNESTFISAFLTMSGYQYLGFEDSTHKFADEGFINGLKSRAGELNDPLDSDWEKGYKPQHDLMILVANDNKVKLAGATRMILEEFKNVCKTGALHIEYGNVLRNETGAGIEHFGYADGTSQPIFLKDEMDDYLARHYCTNVNPIYFDPGFPLNKVLIKDPYAQAGYEEFSYGSYFVFRKLEQNVRGFKQMEGAIKDASGNELGEIAGAYLVGRFEDGSPVTNSPFEGQIDAAAFNNFNYSADPSGGKCPHFAHIRNVNPRKISDSSKPAEFGAHSIVRRGIPFGHRDAPPETELELEQFPEGGVGLLFMCYQASITGQFEAMQKMANTPAGMGGSTTDIDPIIGQPGSNMQYCFPLHYGSSQAISPQPFKPFVTLKGGEYFFAPSIQFFKTL